MSISIFILRRLLFLVTTLVAVSIIIFALTQVLPGDVATMILGMSATPEDLATLRQQMGLDRPVWTQYAAWATGILSGDLGTSTRFGLPVATLVLDRLSNTALLAAFGLAMALPAGVLLGVFCGLRPGRPLDHVFSSASLFAAAMPEFVTGAVLIVVFSGWLGWFPPFSAIKSEMNVFEVLWRLVMPALALNLVILGYMLRMMRSSLIEVLRSPYVRAAVLKGLPRRSVVLRHAMPTAMGPTVTVMALSVGWMTGGLVVVESMFGYPGIGRLLVFAIQNRDIPLIQALSLIVAAAYASANLLADVISRLLDPRTADV